MNIKLFYNYSINYHPLLRVNDNVFNNTTRQRTVTMTHVPFVARVGGFDEAAGSFSELDLALDSTIFRSFLLR